MNTQLHFSSASDNWSTPQNLFNFIAEVYPFDLDVCASETNAKCVKYYTEADDGLQQPWTGVCWMNPPYGRTIGLWMKKAFDSAVDGATVVCLVPSRTDTAWWHEYAMHGKIIFIRGRIKFGGHKNAAPFPSALVIFGGSEERYETLYHRICP